LIKQDNIVDPTTFYSADLLPVDLSWIRDRPAFPRDADLPRDEVLLNDRDWNRYDILVRTQVRLVRKSHKLSMSDADIDRHIRHVDLYKGDDAQAKKKRDHLLTLISGLEKEDRKSTVSHSVTHVVHSVSHSVTHSAIKSDYTLKSILQKSLFF
jgi:hypothetical protein